MRVFLILTFSLTWASVNCNNRITIKSAGSWDWGTWHQMVHCPIGMYAKGMEIKYEWRIDSVLNSGYDDTSLNAVRLYCNDPNSPVCSTNYPILSGNGDRGAWQGNLWCPTGQVIIGFGLRVHLWEDNSDDMAATTVKAACGSPLGPRTVSTWIEGKTDDVGLWNPSEMCPEGYAVCGIQSRIDHEITHDRLGLVNVYMDCCAVTDIPCIPGYELPTLASYDNTQEMLNAVDYMATSINLGIKNKKDHVTGFSFRSMVQGALLHESQASVTIEIPKKQKAVVKQLYLTCGSYRISLPKTIQEGTKKEGAKKPKKKYSHEHDAHHKNSEEDHDGDDEC